MVLWGAEVRILCGDLFCVLIGHLDLIYSELALLTMEVSFILLGHRILSSLFRPLQAQVHYRIVPAPHRVEVISFNIVNYVVIIVIKLVS